MNKICIFIAVLTACFFLNGSAQTAYITNQGDGTVSAINVTTNAVIATINVGSQPIGVSCSHDGTRAYVTNYNSNTVSVINTASNSVIATIPVGNSPWGIVVSPNGDMVYVANQGGNNTNADSVSIISTATNSVIANIMVGNNPHGICTSPDGSKIYVSNQGSNTVMVIDSAGFAVIATIPVGVDPEAIVATPDGNEVFVEMANNGNGASVSVIRTSSNSVISTIGVGHGTVPSGMAITPDGSKVFVSNGDNTVSVINTSTNMVEATIPVGAVPEGISVTPDGTKAIVANNSSSEVTVIATATNSVTNTINVGTTPIAFGNFISGNSPCNAVSPVISFNNSIVFCQGDSITLSSNTMPHYLWSNGATTNSITVHTSGNYFLTVTDQNGCTGTASITITVNASYTIQVAAETCMNSHYTFPDHSMIIVNADTVQTSLLHTVNSCDSIITTTLTILPIYNINRNDSTCIGSVYTFPDNTIITATHDTLHKSILHTAVGCDSIITTMLIVNPVYSSNAADTICQGSVYIFPDGSMVTAMTDTIQTSILHSIYHCDSAIITSLNVLPSFSETIGVALCQGMTYQFPDNSIITAMSDTIQTSHFLNVNNCDSLIITNLTVHPLYMDSVSANACIGSIYIFPDNSMITVTVDTIQTSHLTTINNCDSIITTSLTTLPVPNATITPNDTVTFCSGDSLQLTANSSMNYLWNNGNTSQSIWALDSGNYTVTVTGNNGCTRGSAITLVVLKPTPPTPTITIHNDTVLSSSNNVVRNQWLLNGNPLTGDTSTTYTATVTGCYSVEAIGVNGCSSVSDTVCITITTGIRNISSLNAISLYPNPNNGSFNLVIEAINNSPITINISDVLGQIIYSENDKTNTSSFSKGIDISYAPEGIYFIGIKIGDTTINRMIVVSK